MASSGITFGAAKSILASVIENGIDPDDPRVKIRTDEAQQEIVDSLIPVNGMATYDVVASGTTLLLPKELKNAIFVEVLGGASVNGDTDVTFGWYNIVNQFAYVDPSMMNDLTLVDQFDQPDPNDATISRRQYDFPGLTPNSTVRVTGAKRWLPIVDDSTYLIVQNVPALKEMAQAVEYAENNDPQNADAFRGRCLQRLQSEVKIYQLDPINYGRRKGDYLKDLVAFQEYTFGWMRANMALEVPGALAKGKMDINFALGQAEKRLMQRGIWKDCIREYSATVTGGQIALPLEVESVLGIDLCGTHIPIRSQFFEYLDNGPGQCTSHPLLLDNGEQTFVDGRRRVYNLKAAPSDQNQTITMVCKLKWREKRPTDMMVIRNFNALRLMMAAIFSEEKEDYQGAQANQALAVQELDKELRDFLGGIEHTPRIQTYGFGLGSVGGNL